MKKKIKKIKKFKSVHDAPPWIYNTEGIINPELKTSFTGVIKVIYYIYK